MLRFAPSPTGDMHIGNLRVALINHILSKQLNEELLIRIEDTDKKRNVDGKSKEILELLTLFSVNFQRVVHQSENLKYHSQMAMKLLLDKKAFNCFCSDEALEQDRKKAKDTKQPYRYSGFCTTISDETKFECNAPFTVRLKKPEQNIKFIDAIKGEFNYKPFDVDSNILLRQDKTPMYNFACAVDDMLFDISTVIRGEDQMPNTPKQIHIRESLGYTRDIQYAHLPMILNMDTGKKMSKRDNTFSVKWLVDEGYLPVAISNYIILLGYNPPTEIFTLEEAQEWFDINKISKAPAKFDITKLKFINREHIKIMDELRLSKILGYADKDIGTLAKIYIEECDTIKEIKSKIDLIFTQKNHLENFEEEFKLVKESLQKAPFIDNFSNLKKYLIDQTKLKDEQHHIALRFALTGAKSGPNLSKIYPLIKNYLGEIVK
ncbi:MAG: glutamate--tRNA ligase [Campylobacterota bacterium]|nr:glutamate--tRNA ligase [Campylobacterota bacterium]